MSERYQKVLRLGVRFNGSTFELLDGRPLPKFAQDCEGELLLPPHSILDDKLLAEFQHEQRLPFLAKNTEVYLGMSPGAIEAPVPHGLIRPEDMHLQSGYLLVGVMLLQDLLLRYRGDQKAWLADCECAIPALGKSLEKPAASLNHAFTLASSHYEKKRRQHNANIFIRAWTHSGAHWERLDQLRIRAIEKHLNSPSNEPVQGETSGTRSKHG